MSAVFICAALLAGPGGAQAPRTEKGGIIGRGYLFVGGHGLGLSGVNGHLNKSGYSGFSNPVFSYGGGGHVLINRFLVGGEGRALVEKSANGTGRKAGLSGGYGLFNIGYVAFSKGGLSVYPFLGLGAGAVGLEISGEQTAAFEDIIADPGRMSKLTSYGLILSFNIGADSLIRTGGDKGSGGGFVVGARAGFSWSPAKAEWEMPGVTISGGPDIGFTGFYIGLLLGLGGG